MKLNHDDGQRLTAVNFFETSSNEDNSLQVYFNYVNNHSEIPEHVKKELFDLQKWIELKQDLKRIGAN